MFALHLYLPLGACFFAHKMVARFARGCFFSFLSRAAKNRNHVEFERHVPDRFATQLALVCGRAIWLHFFFCTVPNIGWCPGTSSVVSFGRACRSILWCSRTHSLSAGVCFLRHSRVGSYSPSFCSSRRIIVDALWHRLLAAELSIARRRNAPRHRRGASIFQASTTYTTHSTVCVDSFPPRCLGS